MRNTHPKRPQGISAFSLGELMVSLAVVGTLAAITTPVALHNMAEAHNRAVLKETIGMLSRLTAQASAEGKLVNGQVAQWYLARLNVKTTCPNMAMSTAPAPCALQHVYSNTWGTNGEGAVLANGAQVEIWKTFLQISGDGSIHAQFMIDANGAEGPNIEGKDMLLQLAGNIGQVPGRQHWETPVNKVLPREPGTVSPIWDTGTSMDLYRSLFSS
jgi:type II secretory pathway pseudopilin PulG